MKHRSCTSCGKQRPSVLFPKLSNGAYGKRCQLCVDTAKTPKDLVAFRTRGRRAQEKKAEMVKANREVSVPYARTRARDLSESAHLSTGVARGNGQETLEKTHG